jgi:DNA-binding transcriptional LysR family regulator
MELHEIRYFLAVCETLNFTRAAGLCHVGQPALTRAIQKLEREFGGLLFCREGPQTHLTHLGRLLHPILADVQRSACEAGHVAQRFIGLQAASLELGVMRGIGPRHFIHFLQRFNHAAPGIMVTLREDAAEDLTACLLAGTREVAVLACPEAFDPRLQVMPLYREGFVAALPANHLLAGKPGLAAYDLDGAAYLARSGCAWRDKLLEVCAAYGGDLVTSYRGTQEDWIQAMVAAGMGMCFLPEFTDPAPGVVTRPILVPVVAREICLVTVAGRRWSAPLARLMDVIRRHSWPRLAAPRAVEVAA